MKEEESQRQWKDGRRKGRRSEKKKAKETEGKESGRERKRSSSWFTCRHGNAVSPLTCYSRENTRENNTQRDFIHALSFSLWHAVGHTRVATPLSLSTYQRVNLFAMQIPSDRC